VILLSVVSLILRQSMTVQKHCLIILCLIFSIGLTSYNLYAQDESNNVASVPQEENTIKLPPVEIIEGSTEIISENSEDKICRAFLVNKDIEIRYQKIQKDLETDYKEGLPNQLKMNLIGIRRDIDSLTVKLFDVDYNDSQEINNITKLTIDYLERMIGILPKANKIGPQIRDRYVVPFTNINSIKAEHQDCLMQAAIEDVKNKKAEPDVQGASINIYEKLTAELEHLNKNLYTLQTTDVSRFISYRAKLLADLENYNKSQANGFSLTTKIPQVLNTVHTEIERLLPGLELSKKYYSIVQ